MTALRYDRNLFWQCSLRSMLPQGLGWIVTVRAVFDESYDSEVGLCCVAGYVFHDEQFLAFEDDWQAILNEYRISIFHAADCAHGIGEFAHLSKSQRQELYKRLIDSLKSHLLVGAAISVDSQAFENLSWPTGKRYFRSEYTLCVSLSLAYLARYLDDRGLLIEPVAYLLESGDGHQGEADALIQAIAENEIQSSRYRYASHTFSRKGTAHALGAADLLAWEFTQQRRRDLGWEHRAPRKSLLSLTEKPHVVSQLDSSNISIAVAEALWEPYVLKV